MQQRYTYGTVQGCKTGNTIIKGITDQNPKGLQGCALVVVQQPPLLTNRVNLQHVCPGRYPLTRGPGTAVSQLSDVFLLEGPCQ